MPTKILIPTPFRPYTDKKDAVDAEGKTVGELLADLTARHAGLKPHLYNEQGRLRSFVNVYVNDEFNRYSRHLIMPEVGVDGQRKLKAAKVLCIGAGGLGSPVAMYLAAAGVGTLGIVD